MHAAALPGASHVLCLLRVLAGPVPFQACFVRTAQACGDAEFGGFGVGDYDYFVPVAPKSRRVPPATHPLLLFDDGPPH